MVGSMQPGSVTKSGRPYGRPPFAAGRRLFASFCVGLIFVPLMFLSPVFGWGMLGWNVILLLLYVADLRSLPKPHKLRAVRSFTGVLNQLRASQVILTLTNTSTKSIHCSVTDAIPQSFCRLSPEWNVVADPRIESLIQHTIHPSERGDHSFGKVFVRYESRLRLAQAWAAFDLNQTVRVYPTLRHSDEQQAILLRSRQIEMQMRLVRQRGHGREFESLREFQNGDERRDICWTATARRSKLVTTLRQSERSQTIWAVVDCGRLMRARLEGRSKLDYATETVMRLAQLANYGGDSSAMLAYGLHVQQRRLPGKGNHHLHAMLDQLALLKEESAEADHLLGAGAILSAQKRRAMIVWITDLADLAITPEVVTAALHANRRHLVVLAVLGQPDVVGLAENAPSDADETFLYAAATETIRRRELTLARLKNAGVHVIEVNAPHLTGAVLNKYLEVKQKNLL